MDILYSNSFSRNVAFNCLMFLPEISNRMVSVNGKHPEFHAPKRVNESEWVSIKKTRNQAIQMAEDQNTNIDSDMKTVFDATAIIRKSITKCTKWKFTGSLKNLPDENVPVEPFFYFFIFYFVMHCYTHWLQYLYSYATYKTNRYTYIIYNTWYSIWLIPSLTIQRLTLLILPTMQYIHYLQYNTISYATKNTNAYTTYSTIW